MLCDEHVSQAHVEESTFGLMTGMPALCTITVSSLSSAGIVDFKEFSRFLQLDDYELDSALHRGKYITLNAMSRCTECFD